MKYNFLPILTWRRINMKRVLIMALCIWCVWIPSSVEGATIQLTKDGKTLKQIETSNYLLSSQIDLLVDWKKIENLSDMIASFITKKPVNAKLDKHGKVISGKSGVALDKKKFQKLVGDLVANQEQGKIEIPKKQIHPQVDSEFIVQIKTNKLGTYTTYFKDTHKERSNNIKLAAEAIDNQIIFPGDDFSFNETVGERTKEKGYMQAPVIVKGELSEGIGGGICQVSSTLYNAVDLVGLDILKRYSHSRNVPYVPPGRDATVSWFGPDFIFENPYNQPILIRAFVEEGKMIVTLYSSDSIQIKRKNIPELQSD